jgi:hypothetical protein
MPLGEWDIGIGRWIVSVIKCAGGSWGISEIARSHAFSCHNISRSRKYQGLCTKNRQTVRGENKHTPDLCTSRILWPIAIIESPATWPKNFTQCHAFMDLLFYQKKLLINPHVLKPLVLRAFALLRTTKYLPETQPSSEALYLLIASTSLYIHLFSPSASCPFHTKG